MKLKIFLSAIIFLLLLVPGKSFAEMPDVTAGKIDFDILQGKYFLEKNVFVKVDNHGFTATVAADKAEISMVTKTCIAEGNVTFTHGNFSLACKKAFADWNDKKVDAQGKVKFIDKNIVNVNSEKATFSLDEKIIDFTGKVEIKPEKNFKPSETFTPDKKKKYSHVRYNIETKEFSQPEGSEK